MKKGVITAIVFLALSKCLLAQFDTSRTAVVYSWKVDELGRESRTPVDTILDGFNLFYDYHDQSLLTQYLGNYGSSNQSLNYFNRKLDRFDLLQKQYHNYSSHSLKHNNYYNTRKPFTLLGHTTGGSRNESEQTLDVFHTQNISPRANIGFNYHLISSQGRYSNQVVTGNYLRAFGSYKWNKYKAHFNFVRNRQKQGENGGIDSLHYLGSAQFSNPANIPVKLDEDARSRFHNTGFYFHHQYNLWSAMNPEDSLNLPSNKTKGLVLGHQFVYDQQQFKFIDENPVEAYYTNFPIYIDTLHIHDELQLNKFSNLLYLGYEEEKIEIKAFGRYVNHQYLNNILPDSSFSEQDTTVITNKDVAYKDFSAGGIAYFNISNILKAVFNTEWYLSGYYAGDFYTRARIILGNPNKRTGELSGMLAFEKKQPHYNQQYYSSNNFLWDTTFKALNNIDLQVKYMHKNLGLELSLMGKHVENYLYYNSKGVYEQSQKALNVAGVYAREQFNLGSFYFDLAALYQYTNSKAVSLPELTMRHRLWYDHHFHFEATGGDLYLELGAVLWYFSEYNADRFMPQTGLYYQQNIISAGPYPWVDVFANVRLKRTRFFFTYSHLNQALGSEDYYNTPYYPYPPAVFKFGLSWSFYD